MKRYAFIFPGQGAQYVGMGKEFADHFAIARQTFEEVDDLLGDALSKIIFQGPAEALTLTKNSQLAIFATSVAIVRALEQQMPTLKAAAMAGLSLGEYTALFASGRLGFKETLLLVRERAQFMNAACEKTSGAMAVVLGMDAAQIEAVLAPLKEVWIANYNCPGQIVISGTHPGVAQASEALKSSGAKRVMPLTVHGAFHSPLMQSAQDALAPYINRAPLKQSSIAFAMNAPGTFVNDVEEIRRFLTCQVTHSVRWEQCVRSMDAEGIDAYFEIGCGKTLTGMNKKIGVSAVCLSIEKPLDLEAVQKYREGCTSCNC